MIAIYARQSIEKKDSVSIETQIQLCKNLITNNENYEVYEDRGFSGKNTLRPSFEKLIKDTQDNKLTKIIVYRLDRFSRNIIDFYTVWNILKEHNVEFVSVSEQFDTSTPLGRALIGILAIFAQMERETIAERVKDNYYSRVIEKKGSWVGGPAPFGFANGKNEKGEKTLLIDENEIEAVYKIYNWYANGKNNSLGDVCRYLLQENFESRKRKTFDNVTVARILQNPIYVIADETLYNYFKSRQCKILNEKEEWNGTTSAHIIGKKVGNVNIRSYTTMKEQSVYLTNIEGIIDSTTYIKAQAKLSKNQQLKRSNKIGNLKELSGLIKCGCCGYAIKSYSKSTTGEPYLSCYGNYGLKLCNVSYKGKGVKFYEIRKKVLQEIQYKIEDLEKLYEQEEINIYELIEEKNTKEKDLNRLLEIATKSPALSDLVVKQMEEIQRKITDLYVEIEKVKSEKEIYNLDLMKMAFTNIDLVNDNAVEFNKVLVRKLIEKIELQENGDITIHWKL